MVNCQSALVWLALRSCSQAARKVREVTIDGAPVEDAVAFARGLRSKKQKVVAASVLLARRS